MAQAHAAMKDEMTTEEPVAVDRCAVKTDFPMPFTNCPANINCYRCIGLYARNCQY